MAFVNQQKDTAGAAYTTTWFDMFRIEDGKIAEHWDCDTKEKYWNPIAQMYMILCADANHRARRNYFISILSIVDKSRGVAPSRYNGTRRSGANTLTR